MRHAIAWPRAHRGDFLTMPFRGSSSAYWSGQKYYEALPDVRAEYRAAIKARGYTRLYLDLFGKWGPKQNYFELPERLRPVLVEAVNDGLGPVVFIGPEDDKDAQRRYGCLKGQSPAERKKGRTLYKSCLKRLLRWCGHAIADLILGVEVEEYWPDAELAEIGADARRFYKGNIWVHRSTGEHGPWSWWKAQNWVTGLAYQFTKRDMKKPGFLAHPDDMKAEMALYSARLKTQGGRKKFLAFEYAFERPEVTVRRVARQAGLTEFANGGAAPT